MNTYLWVTTSFATNSYFSSISVADSVVYSLPFGNSVSKFSSETGSSVPCIKWFTVNLTGFFLYKYITSCIPSFIVPIAFSGI